MKKYITIATLIAAGSAFANAGTIVLDSGKDGAAASLYQDIVNGTTSWNGNNSGTYTVVGGSITFYVDVADLFGATMLKDTGIYTLDSFSYIGNDKGWFTGDDRALTVSNGVDSITFVQGAQGNKFHTTDFTAQTNLDLLTFKKSDRLTITLAPTQSNANVSVNYYDTNSPGVSFTLKDGEVNDGIDHTLNPGTTNWKYNSPAIRLTATLIPEPSAFGLLAGLGALALVGTRRRRR